MKKIYVILSQTGTLFSKAIKLHTKDPYNHASISFDNKLETMYSFGRKRRYNPIDTGLIEENFNKGLFPYFPNARCCVLEIPVTQREYDIMAKLVEDFYNHKENYRYNLMGILGYALGLKLTRKDHFFCSQFVSYILNNTGRWNLIPELTKPMDFLKFPNSKIIYEGSIVEFMMINSADAFMVS